MKKYLPTVNEIKSDPSVAHLHEFLLTLQSLPLDDPASEHWFNEIHPLVLSGCKLTIMVGISPSLSSLQHALEELKIVAHLIRGLLEISPYPELASDWLPKLKLFAEYADKLYKNHRRWFRFDSREFKARAFSRLKK